MIARALSSDHLAAALYCAIVIVVAGLGLAGMEPLP